MQRVLHSCLTARVLLNLRAASEREARHSSTIDTVLELSTLQEDATVHDGPVEVGAHVPESFPDVLYIGP